MKLGKIYARMKREVNAADISVTFSMHNFQLPTPHRKMKILMLLSIYGMRMNGKAYERECGKYHQKIERWKNGENVDRKRKLRT